MFYPSKIININNKTEEKKRLDTERRNKALERANYFKKNRLLKIQRLINGLVRLIESSSGWMYTTDSFILKSDFHYDGDMKDITFKINRIKRGESGYYLSKEPSTRESSFYTVYKEVLDKIFDLEEKRERLYESIPTYEEKVIDFDKAKKEYQIKRYNNPNYTRNYIMAQAKDFINNYGIDGLRRLIKILNKLTNITDPMDVYNELKSEGISFDYIESIFRWAAIYSIKGDQVLDHILNQKLSSYNYELPDYEERMTDNIIRLL